MYRLDKEEKDIYQYIQENKSFINKHLYYKLNEKDTSKMIESLIKKDETIGLTNMNLHKLTHENKQLIISNQELSSQIDILSQKLNQIKLREEKRKSLYYPMNLFKKRMYQNKLSNGDIGEIYLTVSKDSQLNEIMEYLEEDKNIDLSKNKIWNKFQSSDKYINTSDKKDLIKAFQNFIDDSESFDVVTKFESSNIENIDSIERLIDETKQKTNDLNNVFKDKKEFFLNSETLFNTIKNM